MFVYIYKYIYIYMSQPLCIGLVNYFTLVLFEPKNVNLSARCFNHLRYTCGMPLMADDDFATNVLNSIRSWY